MVISVGSKGNPTIYDTGLCTIRRMYSEYNKNRLQQDALRLCYMILYIV